MALERAFARAGGMLIAGTDPTGSGGVIPGYLESAADRAAGRRRLHAARGDRDRHAERRPLSRTRGAHRIASPQGKQADLVVLNGDPSTNIADIRKVDTVFRQGVGFSPPSCDSGRSVGYGESRYRAPEHSRSHLVHPSRM